MMAVQKSYIYKKIFLLITKEISTHRNKKEGATLSTGNILKRKNQKYRNYTAQLLVMTPLSF